MFWPSGFLSDKDLSYHLWYFLYKWFTVAWVKFDWCRLLCYVCSIVSCMYNSLYGIVWVWLAVAGIVCCKNIFQLYETTSVHYIQTNISSINLFTFPFNGFYSLKVCWPTLKDRTHTKSMGVCVTLQSYQLQEIHPSTPYICYCSVSHMHLCMDTVSNLSGIFMYKYIHMHKYV